MLLILVQQLSVHKIEDTTQKAWHKKSFQKVHFTSTSRLYIKLIMKDV